MYEIKEKNIVTIEQKLLFNIWESLNPKEPKVETKTYQCKACGKTHDNKGQLMACAKKHKKAKEVSV